MRDPKYISSENSVTENVARKSKVGKDSRRDGVLPFRSVAAPESQTPRSSSSHLRTVSRYGSPLDEFFEDAREAVEAEYTGSDFEEKFSHEHRARAGWVYNFLSRIAIRTAPLCSWLYDCQMSFGGVRVVNHRQQLPHYPTGAPPLKVAYLSDFHYGPTTGRAAPRQAWKLAREAQPDVILLGGDFLFADERGLPTLLRELQRWKFDPPPGGMYACLGNHDYYSGKDTIMTCLEACGVRVLVNDAVPLPSPWKGVWIAGVDDLWHGQPDLGEALARVSPDACTILLAHEPDICESPHLRKVAITLAGHTHGGQICLPHGEPIFVPSKHGREYSGGLYRHAGQWLFVSRGIGTVGLPLRLFAPPDIGVLEFHGRVTRGAR